MKKEEKKGEESKNVDIEEIAREMRSARGGVLVKDRYYHLKKYKQVFLGQDCAQVFLHYNDVNSKLGNVEQNQFDGRPHLGLPNYFKGMKL